MTWLVEPDSELRLVYYLRDGVLRVFDTDTFALLGSLIVPQASGTAGSLILAGSETLAFRTDEDQVFLISKQAVKEMLAGVEK